MLFYPHPPGPLRVDLTLLEEEEMRGCLPLVLWAVGLCPAVALALPETRVTAGPVVYTKERNATFTFSSTTTGVSFECSLDGASYTSCVSPKSYSGLADGQHVFLVRAVDASGVDPTPVRYPWTIDNVAPVVQISQPAANAVVGSRAPVVKGTVDNPYSKVRVFIDQELAGSVQADEDGDWTVETTVNLGNGPHSVSAEATDPADNVGARSASIPFEVNTTPPETSIVEGPPSIHYSRIAVFIFESPSGATNFECQLDDAAGFTACAAAQLFTNLAEGSHTLKVRAKDSAGNVDPSPSVHQWRVSLQAASAPEILEPADGAVVDTELPVISGRTQAQRLVAVYIDDVKSGVALADESGAWSFRPTAPLKEGEHKLNVGSLDASGNTLEPRSATRSFSVSLGGCAASGAQPLLPLVGLVLLAMRRRRV